MIKITAALIFGLLFFKQNIAMEEPIPGEPQTVVSLTAPFEAETNKFKIRALLNDQKIGSVRYINLNKSKGIWHITKLKVKQEHRNKKDKRVGFKLFNAAIKDMYQKHASQIEWTVVPRNGSGLNVKELENIYEKIVKKLELPPHIFHKKPFPYNYCTEMTLKFK